MSKVKEGLYYSPTHEWIQVTSGKEALIGITDFAQSELGTVVFVDLPEVGASIEKDQEFGAIESIKAASDLVSPVTGKVLLVNDDLVGDPEKINEDAYQHWLIKVELADLSELEALLSASDYQKSIG